jgi:hypothetical protein
MLNWGSSIKERNGEWQGLNNAAIYSFNSNIINSFVREMFQNSIDARNKKLPKDASTGKIPPLKIRINYKEIVQDEFPDFAGFYDIFKSIAGSKPNKQHSKFFNNGFKALGDKKKIPLFLFEDYNTTGLSGADDDPENTFNACVISEGISVNKDPTAGGSFGIGKNAIYGLSKLRTIFYSSVNNQGDYIFQGKAKLASYYDDKDKTRDNKIYCGKGELQNSTRTIKELEEPFNALFKRTEPGLSQFAVCPVENKNWPEEFAKAILRNYWMLLEKGELVVELLNQDKNQIELNGNNLEVLMQEYFDPESYEPEDVLPKGNPWEFYNCYKNGKCLTKTLDKLGEVRFYFNEVDNKNTNCIAFLRNDMVVFTEAIWGFGSIGYCGLFMCDSDKGNEILRAMEPPTHDSISPERLHEKMDGYSLKDGQKILSKINELVKGGLQEIMDEYTKPVEDIPWLDNLLSSLTGAAGIGAGDRMNEESKKETTEKIGKEVKKTLNFDSLKRNSVINDITGEIEGTGGGNPSPGPAPGPGPQPGTVKMKKSKIKSRIFRTEKESKVGDKTFHIYQVHLTSKKSILDTDIIISQQGDSGNVVMFELGKVEVIGGSQLTFAKEKNKKSETVGYRIKSLDVPNIIELYVHEPYKSSFRIIKS